MVHEAGHAFGLVHNTNVASVMNEDYQGVRTGLASTDVANLRALYGTRQADAFEGAGGNDTLATAAAIPTTATGVLFARGDITTPADVDCFQFTAASKDVLGSGVTLNFRSLGVSLLAADVTIVDDKGKLVASATSNGQPGVFLSLSPKLEEGHTYYVTVQASAGMDFNVGAYKLAVVYGTGKEGGGKGNDTVVIPPSDPTSTVATPTFVNDGGTAQTLATASILQAVFGTTSQAHYSQFAQLLSVTDVDVYKVQAPATATGTTNLLVSVHAMSSGLPPVLQFYGSDGSLVAAEQVSGTSSAAVYQLRNVAAGSTYGIRVSSAGSLGATLYNLQADFVATAIDTTTTGAGTLGGTHTTAFHTLIVNQPQVMSFNFQAKADGLSSPTTLWVQLYDSAGNTVSLWMVQTGAFSTQSLLLQPGEYTFKIWAAFDSTSTAVDYSLRLTSDSNPIGIALADPTLMPPIAPPVTYTTPPPPVVKPPFQFYTYDPSYYAWLITPM